MQFKQNSSHEENTSTVNISDSASDAKKSDTTMFKIIKEEPIEVSEDKYPNNHDLNSNKV